MTSVCCVEPPDQQLPSVPHRDEAPGAERRRETEALLRQTQRHRGRIVPLFDPLNGHKQTALTSSTERTEMEPTETNSPDWTVDFYGLQMGTKSKPDNCPHGTLRRDQNKLISYINMVPTAAFSRNSSTFWDGSGPQTSPLQFHPQFHSIPAETGKVLCTATDPVFVHKLPMFLRPADGKNINHPTRSLLLF